MSSSTPNLHPLSDYPIYAETGLKQAAERVRKIHAFKSMRAICGSTLTRFIWRRAASPATAIP